MSGDFTVSELVVQAPKPTLATFSTKTRSIADFTAQVTVREDHVDELTLTDHPVEYGAQISDHAYKNPARLTVLVGWSNSPQQGLLSSVGGALLGTVAPGLAVAVSTVESLVNLTSGASGSGSDIARQVYQRLLALQASRKPFSVTTGKRQYSNMLITSLATTTDQKTENSLIVTCAMREIIIVETTTTTIPPSENQADPASTASPVNSGTQQAVPATSANAKSILQILGGG